MGRSAGCCKGYRYLRFVYSSSLGRKVGFGVIMVEGFRVEGLVFKGFIV